MPYTATNTISPSVRQPRPMRDQTETSRLHQFIQALSLFTACTTILIVAYFLAPNPISTVSPSQLGLHPCGFKQATSLPCASCGMTTSFSHMAHGRFFTAFVNQPAGSLLALLAAMGSLVGLWAMVTGMSLMPLWMKVFQLRWVVAFVAFVLVVWVYLLVRESIG